MRNFWIYMVGMILFVGALAYGADLLGLREAWIWIGIVALIGVGVMAGIVKTGRGS